MASAEFASPAVSDALVILGAAGLVIPVFTRFRVTPIIGFILIGILVGPYGLGRLVFEHPMLNHITISDPEALEPFAEFGIILLLFTIGLELSFNRLWQMRKLVFGLGAAELLIIGSSIAVVLACRFLIPADDFAAWGWRLPFLLSLVLLAVSLWMRLKLSESPVFQAMKAAGETSKNPFVESFTYPGNKWRILVALFGITGSLTTIWYTAFFSSLSFLKGPMRVDALTTELLLFAGGLISMPLYVVVGKWSDRVGRKKPIVIGQVITLLLLFPTFWFMGQMANPGLVQSANANPVSVAGPRCDYDPFADAQATDCGRLIEDLTTSGVPYTLSEAPVLSLGVGASTAMVPDYPAVDPASRRAALQERLTAAGYDFSTQHPGPLQIIGVLAALSVMAVMSALTYGPVAALLAEMFPPRIRYSSMSIPYHIGAGYFGGFLPLIAAYIIARTGDAYAGLWYTWGFMLIGLIFAVIGLKGGPPRDFHEAELDDAGAGARRGDVRTAVNDG